MAKKMGWVLERERGFTSDNNRQPKQIIELGNPHLKTPPFINLAAKYCLLDTLVPIKYHVLKVLIVLFQSQ